MKRLFVLLLLATSSLCASAQSSVTEVRVDGKVFDKKEGNVIASRPKSQFEITRAMYSPEQLQSILSRLYVLNSDHELKTALKMAFTAEILSKYKNERVRLSMRITPDGKVFDVKFLMPDEYSPIYDMDIAVYSKLEDAIKSTFRFYIPNKAVSVYNYTLSLNISRFLTDEPLFNPGVYKKRQRLAATWDAVSRNCYLACVDDAINGWTDRQVNWWTIGVDYEFFISKFSQYQGGSISSDIKLEAIKQLF